MSPLLFSLQYTSRRQRKPVREQCNKNEVAFPMAATTSAQPALSLQVGVFPLHHCLSPLLQLVQRLRYPLYLATHSLLTD